MFLMFPEAKQKQHSFWTKKIGYFVGAAVFLSRVRQLQNKAYSNHLEATLLIVITVDLLEPHTGKTKKKKSLLKSRFVLENLIANFQDPQVLENVSQQKTRGVGLVSQFLAVQLIHCEAS